MPLGQAEHEADRLDLGGGRPALEPGRVAARIGSREAGVRGVDRRRQLGVHQERQLERRDHRHRLVQVGFADARKFVHAGRHEEALEAARAVGRQLRQLPRVARHDSAPERDVDAERGALGRVTLDAQCRG